MILRVELPWPPKQLTPNFKRRKHWSAYRPHTKRYRHASKILARAAGVRVGMALTSMTITFVPPDRRLRDDDGMIGSFKAGRDGIADALGIDDLHFRPTYAFGEPAKPGSVTVELMVVEPN